MALLTLWDRLERWTGSLLAYLLPIKPQLKIVKFTTILEGALLPLIQKIRDKNITIIKNIDAELVDIRTDEHLLEQVFYNLIFERYRRLRKTQQNHH